MDKLVFRRDKLIMTRDEIIKYWLDGSGENYKSSQNMFKTKEYTWSLFIGHLSIEKLLKAIYVKEVDVNVPRTHDLYKIALKTGLALTEEQKDDLQYITLFNIEARYEEYKKDFSQKCTKCYVQDNLHKISELRKWLLAKIES